MQYFIQVSDNAKLDLKEALEYYSDISEDLRDRFEIELDKTIAILSKKPLQHQVRYKNIRIAFTAVFPYRIHYIIENEFVYILKILHTKRFFKF